MVLSGPRRVYRPCQGHRRPFGFPVNTEYPRLSCLFVSISHGGVPSLPKFPSFNLSSPRSTYEEESHDTWRVSVATYTCRQGMEVQRSTTVPQTPTFRLDSPHPTCSTVPCGPHTPVSFEWTMDLGYSRTRGVLSPVPGRSSRLGLRRSLIVTLRQSRKDRGPTREIFSLTPGTHVYTGLSFPKQKSLVALELNF